MRILYVLNNYFFQPSLTLALSVDSMELFAPHKMALIRPRHSNERVLDPRMVVLVAEGKPYTCCFS